MSNNPFYKEVKDHIERAGNISQNDALWQKCQDFELSRGCPCVGRTNLPGDNVKLVSTHPGYPDYNGPACVTEISGEQLQVTPEYTNCLLAATCEYFFPDLRDKFDAMCSNPRECNIPQYVGYGNRQNVSMLSPKW